jgi:hypothetical protein
MTLLFLPIPLNHHLYVKEIIIFMYIFNWKLRFKRYYTVIPHANPLKYMKEKIVNNIIVK